MTDKPPKGGWQGPPVTDGIPALRTAVGVRRGKWIWKENKLTPKQKKKREKFFKKMAKADRKGEWQW